LGVCVNVCMCLCLCLCIYKFIRKYVYVQMNSLKKPYVLGTNSLEPPIVGTRCLKLLFVRSLFVFETPIRKWSCTCMCGYLCLCCVYADVYAYVYVYVYVNMYMSIGLRFFEAPMCSEFVF